MPLPREEHCSAEGQEHRCADSATAESGLRHDSPDPESNLPVEFAAFCALYRGRYLQYANSRLSDPRTADIAVHLALTELAQQWQEALRSPHTNAYAWRLLNRHISIHACSTDGTGPQDGGGPGGRTGMSLLTDHTNETRILHQDLGMPFDEATELMGHASPRPPR
ncbi:hypothetical protein [Streptomyces albus]|uniref:hypothetical protein n=1 Tax=Streptomyces albus TaxID=1888 RepID=UPI0006E1D2A1|nr:hypothetical protein [Streptomyces albus]